MASLRDIHLGSVVNESEPYNVYRLQGRIKALSDVLTLVDSIIEQTHG